jgi:hypothetical protein
MGKLERLLPGSVIPAAGITDAGYNGHGSLIRVRD